MHRLSFSFFLSSETIASAWLASLVLSFSFLCICFLLLLLRRVFEWLALKWKFTIRSDAHHQHFSSKQWWTSVTLVMGCCGLCRAKATNKSTSKHLAPEKLTKIDLWIENIEGPYDPIDLPVNPPDEPKIIPNKDELKQNSRNQNTMRIGQLVFWNDEDLFSVIQIYIRSFPSTRSTQCISELNSFDWFHVTWRQMIDDASYRSFSILESKNVHISSSAYI